MYSLIYCDAWDEELNEFRAWGRCIANYDDYHRCLCAFLALSGEAARVLWGPGTLVMTDVDHTRLHIDRLLAAVA